MEEESKEGFKRCSKCGRVLPITHFYNCKSSKDGLQYYCKDCYKAMHAEWYQTHRDSELKRAAERRAKNPTYNAEWRAKNPTYNADYSDPQKNPMNWAKRMVNGYRHMDRERFGYDSKTITAEWFLEHIAYQPCAHCGKQGIGLIGCNRLDNTKGHTIDNVEPCCQSCNFSQNIRDQLERGLHWTCKHKKQSFSFFVKEHLNEKSKK